MDSLLPSLYLSAEEKNKIEFSRLVQKCKNVGIKISDSDILKYDCKSFASKYIHKIITKDINNKEFIDEDVFENSSLFYRKYMSDPNSPLYVEMDDIVPDFETASNLIRKCGGFVFVPHIYEYRENSEKILNFILNNHQIDGIECYYTTFSKEQTDTLLKICNDKNLFVSGGSDYHGKNKSKVNMGTGYGNLNITRNITNSWIK